MPNCFTLTRKGNTEPSSLDMVDRALCQQFELNYSPRHYAYGWFDDIGFALAMGATMDKIVDEAKECAWVDRNPMYSTHDDMMVRMSAYLNEHYVANVWAEIGRR